MAGPDSNDNIKEKVQSVREVVPGKSNNEIVLVLQYYDYNVEKAIQAYLEDGAKEALGEWHVPPAKPNKKKKNKKKTANSGQTDNGSSTPTGGAAAPASSTALSSQSPLSSAQPLPQRVPSASNGIIISSSSSTETNNSSTNGNSKTLLSNGMVYSAGSMKDVEVTNMSVDNGSAAAAETSPATNSGPSSSSTSLTKQNHHRMHTGSRIPSHAHGHAQRTRTASERNTASSVGAGGDNHTKRPFQGLEKSIKDLQRQTTSLERLRLVLEHEIERSFKSVKTVFEEMRTHLNTREKELLTEMDVVKQQAFDVFRMRQEKAAALKVHIDRAEKLSDSELIDLRADVKHFVADRKIDEELGKTTRFQYDSDHLKEEILHFGEVIPVKNNYTVRRPSVSSVASSGPGVEEGPPSVPLHPEPSYVLAVPVVPSQEQDSAQMTTEELASLQMRLQNTLKLQGLTEDEGPTASGSDNSVANKDDGQQTKSARRRNRNRERQEQHKNEEESMVMSNPSEESTSRAATPSSTHASAGSASPSPQRGQRSSPQRGGGYRGRGRGGSGTGNYRGGQHQGRGSPRRPYSGGRGGGRGGGGDYNRQGGGRPVVVNGGSS